MTLIKYNPNYRSNTSESFLNFFDKFFYDTLEDSSVNRFLPVANVLEHDKKYEVQMSVPGMKKNDFEIHVEDRKLRITGERNYELDEKTIVHRKELRYGNFERVFQLPEDADQNKISASYTDGILYIYIEKDVKKTQKHKIDVK
jgi:HSP20 family protein